MQHARERRCARVAASHQSAGFPDPGGAVQPRFLLPPACGSHPGAPSPHPPRGRRASPRFGNPASASGCRLCIRQETGRAEGPLCPPRGAVVERDLTRKDPRPARLLLAPPALGGGCLRLSSCSPRGNHSTDSGNSSAENHGAPGSRPRHSPWRCLLQVAERATVNSWLSGCECAPCAVEGPGAALGICQEQLLHSGGARERRDSCSILSSEQETSKSSQHTGGRAWLLRSVLKCQVFFLSSTVGFSLNSVFLCEKENKCSGHLSHILPGIPTPLTVLERQGVRRVLVAARIPPPGKEAGATVLG